MLLGDDGKWSLLNWQSKQIKRVVRSTLAAEIYCNIYWRKCLNYYYSMDLNRYQLKHTLIKNHCKMQ